VNNSQYDRLVKRVCFRMATSANCEETLYILAVLEFSTENTGREALNAQNVSTNWTYVSIIPNVFPVSARSSQMKKAMNKEKKRLKKKERRKEKLRRVFLTSMPKTMMISFDSFQTTSVYSFFVSGRMASQFLTVYRPFFALCLNFCLFSLI